MRVALLKFPDVYTTMAPGDWVVQGGPVDEPAPRHLRFDVQHG